MSFSYTLCTGGHFELARLILALRSTMYSWQWPSLRHLVVHRTRLSLLSPLSPSHLLWCVIAGRGLQPHPTMFKRWLWTFIQTNTQGGSLEMKLYIMFLILPIIFYSTMLKIFSNYAWVDSDYAWVNSNYTWVDSEYAQIILCCLYRRRIGLCFMLTGDVSRCRGLQCLKQRTTGPWQVELPASVEIVFFAIAMPLIT